MQSGFSRTHLGAAIVETLFVVPMLFLLVFITIEFTNILRTYETISWVAEYGVREASEGMSPVSHLRLNASEVKNRIESKLKKLGIKNVDSGRICVRYSNDSGASWDPNWGPANPDPCPAPTNPSSDYGQGNLVRVTIQVTYEPFLPSFLVPRPTFGVTFERVIST